MHIRRFGKRVTILASAVLALMWALAGVAMAQEGVTGSIDASDQSGDGSTVSVSEVTIEGAPGWVVIHLDDDGAPGEVLGQAEIPEGTSTDVTVTLDSPLQGDATLWPMLHVDAGEEGTYEFPGDDVPVVVDEDIVMVSIAYQVELPLTGAPIELFALLGAGLILGGFGLVRRHRKALA